MKRVLLPIPLGPILLGPVLLALAACSAQAPPKPAAPKATQNAKATAKPADPDALPVYRVAVGPAGLMLTDPRGGAARPADFGLRQSLLLAILVRSFGPAAEGRVAPCSSDFARWPNGLTLWFDGGSFSGWSLQEAKTDVTAGATAGVTAGAKTVGIAPGVKRALEMAAGTGCR